MRDCAVEGHTALGLLCAHWSEQKQGRTKATLVAFHAAQHANDVYPDLCVDESLLATAEEQLMHTTWRNRSPPLPCYERQPVIARAAQLASNKVATWNHSSV